MAVVSSGHNRPTEATPQAALEAVTSTTSAVACAMAETRKTNASHSSGLDKGDEVTVEGGGEWGRAWCQGCIEGGVAER